MTNLTRLLHMPASARHVVLAATTAAIITISGCASWPPGGLPPGTPIDTARHGFASPTAEFPLPNGGTRLEFAQGTFGKQTYMLDFDPSGKLVSTEQVLTEQNLASIRPGLPEADLMMRIGRPAHVFSVPWQKLHVWNYRFAGGDCVWYQISVSDVERAVTQSSLGSDPSCDGPNSKD